MQLTYGIDVREEGNDPFVDLIEKANSNFNASTIPGAFPVDFFPVLRSLPEWLPGMGFMETARTWLQDTLAMVEVPYNYTKEQMVTSLSPSFSDAISPIEYRPKAMHPRHSCRPSSRTKNI